MSRLGWFRLFIQASQKVVCAGRLALAGYGACRTA
jgi:hypothetical protein